MEDSPSDHKLCGFLCAVLLVTPPYPNLCQNLAFNTRVHFFSHNSQIGFKSDTGVVLSPLDPKPNPNSEQCQATERERFRDSEQCESISNGDALAEDSEQCEVNVQAKSSTDMEITSRESGRSGERKKRGVRRIGLVNGSLSVVHQLQALVANKCLKIIGRVVRVEIGGDGEARAVVMVDVYLPIAFWSGGQFPKSGSIAGALFRHLSCNWTERTSILASSEEYNKDTSKSDKNIWNLFDCHVLECKLRCSAPDSSKKRLFELDEIFKSIPSVAMKGMSDCSRVKPVDDSCRSGIWELSDDILINILTTLCPMDLIRVAATCRHLRSLAATIMPCMKVKLFPHQQAAVEWMLQRERNTEVLPHPLYMDVLTEDGFHFYINIVSGEIVTGVAPTIKDFHGGLFCDEPGLGKTITALSLVLKTQGTIADPPEGTQVIWCMHNGDQRCGYYELSGDITTGGNMLLGKRLGQSARRGQLSFDKANAEDLIYSSPKRARLMDPDEKIAGFNDFCPDKGMKLLTAPRSEPAVRLVRCTRSLSRIKKNLFPNEGASGFSEGRKVGRNSNTKKRASNGPGHVFPEKQVGMPNGLPYSCKRGKAVSDHPEYNETWVQCDACGKWRKLADASTAAANVAWFCSMNTDPSYQSCRVPEETWDNCESITYLPGFYTKGTSGGMEQNISFFTSVLRDQYALINSQTKKALNWLAKLHPDRLSEMGTIGLVSPFLNTCVPGGDAPGFHRIFQAFGLTRRIEKGMSRWYYPQILDNLAFDVAALRIALCEPLDSVRLYLSQATLIVLPSNLVDHWKTQIEKHVKPGQLRVYVWTDYRKPSAHNLAWDYDVVVTTFNRLSAEWGPRKKSVLMQIHWLRVILDEGHTLGSSLNLTNKLQMALSLTASNRWILTGTPTPNTPNSQLSHLKPMLKFLQEEAYGLDQKSWEAGILKPFEAEMEEGRLRLWELLRRCMISARKIDLQTIPPCIKKVTYLNFNEEHAKSYNELVVTVRRNILMADWNDPSHVESLLNPKQWKFRSTTIRNVRLSCCVAGHIKVTDAGEDIQETMDILVENGLDPTSVEHAFIKYNLLYGGNCNRCKQWCRLPVITPCRHLLCLGCVALDSERCTFPGCGNLYEMQTPETLTRPENPNPKWPVPKDLIELQPSYKQDNWDPDWESTSSSKVSYLVQRLKALQDSNKTIGYFTDESNDSKHMEELFCPSQISNLNVQDCSVPSTNPNKLPLDKVIIFSQFLEHIHVIEQQLMTAGIKFAGMYSPKNSSNKMKSLAMFQHDANCMALLMDGSAALGLDLSFVTHVFLMEPIWDRSLEEQVISRAHRMGANRPIHVETLAMRGTIEEQMLEFLQDADGYRRFLKEEIGKPDREGARAYRSLHDFAETNYLSKLSFVRTNSVM